MKGMADFALKLLDIESNLTKRLNCLTFKDSNIDYIYNPLCYALETHSDYVHKYCLGPKPLLFLGMNPGPHGMAQNGVSLQSVINRFVNSFQFKVPFGEISAVRDWLKIEGTVRQPISAHPRRPIQGLDCKRCEVSGQRFWQLIQHLCGTPQTFFKNSFVHNYCPLTFMLSTGKNVTPPELKAPERKMLYSICDDSLLQTIELIKPKVIVGIGKFASKRATDALNRSNINDIRVESILHPSPANPLANKGWKEIVLQQLCEIQIIDYLKPDMKANDI